MQFDLKETIKYVIAKYDWVDLSIYKNIMYTTVVFCVFFFGLCFYLFYKDLLSAISFGFCVGVGIILLFYYYPLVLKNSTVANIESELAYFLFDLDIRLSVGQDFISAIKSSSLQYEYIGNIMKKIVYQYDNGISLNKSFLEVAKFYHSKYLYRALTQMLNVYRSGYPQNHGPLFSLAEELLSVQKVNLKLYNSKLVLISLIFIGLSAILPSMFLVFVTVGGTILDLGISGLDLLLIFILLFPIIDMLIIFVVYLILPVQGK